MATAFATIEDVRLRWSGMPASEDTVTAVLEDAAVWLRSLFPAIPDSPGENLSGVLRMISCAMVKRSLLAADQEHLSSLTDTAGPFSQSRSFRNPDGNLFLTSQEREMLENALASERGASTGFISVEASGW